MPKKLGIENGTPMITWPKMAPASPKGTAARMTKGWVQEESGTASSA